MKKNFMMIALASVLMMPVSCTKNELEAPQGPAAGELTFVAYAEGGDSKTTLNEEDGSVAWAAGDQIKFDYELEKVAGEAVLSSVLAEGDIVDGAAEFKAALPQAFTMSASDYEATLGADAKNSRHIYATYPATIVTDYSSASEFLVTVPTEQDGTFANASIALAKWNSSKPTAPLQFYNLCGLLQIEIADDAARKIVLTSSTDIAGKASITFPSAPVLKTSDNNALEKEITVNIPGAGTYYVAVLPGELEDVYVAIYDEADVLLGDRTANNAIPVARKQIRKLGTIGTGFADRLYIKAGGTGEGTSWTDAAGVDKLLATMQSAEVVTKNIYVAAGDYDIANKSARPSTGSTLKIYGGYPSDASGYSLAGRDVENNVSRIQNLSGRTFYTQSGNWVFDGMYFYSTGYKTANGCAISLLSGTESVVLNNCRFYECSHASNNTQTFGGIARVETNATITKCKFKDNMSEGPCAGLYIKDANVVMSECDFLSNEASKSGGALYVTGTGVVTANDCTFDSNNSDLNGGAVYFDSINSDTNASSFTNCEFISNSTLSTDSSTGLGSAVGSAGDNNSGSVKFNKCLFEGNTSYNGGSVWTRTVPYYIKDCSFVDNYTNKNNAGVIFIDGSNSPAIYCDGCYFSFTDEGKVGSASAITVRTGKFGMNNCVFAGSWGGQAKVQLTNNATTTIVNSTLFGQIAVNIIKNTGTCNVINSIVPNAGGSGTTTAFTNDGGTLNLSYSLYSDCTTATSTNGCLSGIIVAANSNFPADDNVWYVTNAAAQYKNNQTTTEEVSDVRGYLHYYKWAGSVPSAIGEFTKATSEQVSKAVQNADADFYNWVSASLSKDIRGNVRNTAAMWPGSYEDATATANMENLNVK